MRNITLFCLVILFLSCGHEQQSLIENHPNGQWIDYVNPFIGTGGKGKTYPGAAVPHGMVQLSPDNGRNGWDWISGYFYPDSVISGFSHLHLSGTGAGDLYDISFLPVSGELKKARLDEINTKTTVHSSFSHEREKASPGYYQVYLDDYKVNVELTVTERTGLQRYQFEGEEKKVRLDLGYTRNWDAITESYIRIVNDTTIIGCRNSTGWAKDQRVYFVSIFSEPFSYKLYLDELVQEGDSINGKNILAEFTFEGKEIMVKTGISSVSTNNANQNLNEEQKGFAFEDIKEKAESRWEKQLAKVQIEAEEDDKVQFYTAMYQALLAPTLYSDVNGEYKAADGETWKMEGSSRYTTYSLWDTYRALHPWLTIVEADKATELIHSMLQFYEENGQLPIWNMQGGETDMMIAYHSAPVIADGILKGLAIDKEKAFEALKASANVDKYMLPEYIAMGYVPADKTSWSVSKTMEYAYDDWCIAQVAKILGETPAYDEYMNRSKNYKNHYDHKSNFFRAKRTDGSWYEPFDPLAYHPEDYCEANAWQYYWYVPHDVEHLIELSGGSRRFEAKLDSLFILQQSTKDDPAWISGYIGQYVHGNEPSHHVPYLYQYVDAAYKTEEKLRTIMRTLYNTSPVGLAGNEDCGQMSAWYLFSALGFYPVNPASGEYVLGSPEVQSANIVLEDGKSFKIVANNQSKEAIYVKSVHLNGVQMEKPFLRHEDIMKGGELVFEMSATPSN